MVIESKAANSEPLLYNSRILNIYLSYLESKYPEVEQGDILAYADIRPEEIADQGHWFSQLQVNRFFQRLLQLTGNEQIARDVGRYLGRSNATGLFHRYAFGFLTLEQFLARTQTISAKITKSASYEARVLGPGRIEIVVTPYPGVEEQSFQCQNRMGYFESFWLHYNRQLPTIRHEECLFSGCQVCRYEITLEDRRVLRQDRLRNSALLGLAAVNLAALVAVPSLALSLVAPATLGLLGLLSIVSASQGRRQTMEYIETLGDANARALDRIDHDYQSAQLTKEIGQAISQGGDIDTTLGLVLQSLQRHLQDQRAMLLLLEPNHPGWHYRAHFGFSSGTVSRVRNLPLMLDSSSPESLARFFQQRREPLVLGSRDSQSEEAPGAARSLREALESQTLVLCPIAAEGDLLGLLLVDHQSSQRPLEHSDLNRLMSVAPIIGVAICNARLIEAMADHQEQLAAQVEARTADLREALGAARELTQRAEAAYLAKSQFLANMSHEIRTPLIGVLGMNEQLLQSGLNDEQQGLATTVQKSGETLLELLNDILDYSKIEAGKLNLEQVSFPLLTTVEQAVAPLVETALGKGLELIFDLGATAGLSVEGDPHRLRQVLINLVGNAIKFTPRGEVVLRAELTEFSAGTATVRFSVRDTGIGIDGAVQPTIFESFAQADNSTSRHYGGSGLGLAIVRQLVTLMGGSLGLESALGAGSCFWFTLPLRLVASTEPAAELDIAAGRVLLLTGCAALAEGLRGELELLGQSTHQVADLSAAQARLAADAGHWSLVLVDLALERDPAAGDLAAFCSRQTARGLRVVLLGSHRDCAALQARMERRVEALHKPVRLEPLSELLARSEPAADDDCAASPQPGAEAVQPSRRRILLVEDNPTTRTLVQAMLARLDCPLTMAESGEQALDLWSPQAFDLILMDCHMPGIDGFETTTRLRAAGCRAPILALTARAQRDDPELCRRAGMDDYLLKPFKQKELLALVGRFLPELPAGPRTPDRGEKRGL
jgi:two-component system, NtrC family, C4-dicarboxylate transport sensor histidine kinase DctB